MDLTTGNLTKERIRDMVTAPSGDVVEAEIMPHVYMPTVVVPGLPPIADLSAGGNHTFCNRPRRRGVAVGVQWRGPVWHGGLRRTAMARSRT